MSRISNEIKIEQCTGTLARFNTENGWKKRFYLLSDAMVRAKDHFTKETNHSRNKQKRETKTI